MAISAFAFNLGLKFLLVPALFHRIHSYHYLARQPIPQLGWAVILMLYAAIGIAFSLHSSNLRRAALSVVGAGLWLFLGFEMVLASFATGVWLSDAIFEILVGAGCIIAAMQSRTRIR
jgi:hypothetical protein